GSGEHAMEMNSSTVTESSLDYVSRFADVDDKGVLQKETREYTKAKNKTTSTMSFGEHEGKPTTQNEDLPFEGKTFDLSLKEVAVVDGRKVAKITMTYNLEGEVDIVATMKMQSDDDEGDEPSPKKKGPAGEASFRIKKGTGECQFDLDHAMALSNEMKAD